MLATPKTPEYALLADISAFDADNHLVALRNKAPERKFYLFSSELAGLLSKDTVLHSIFSSRAFNGRAANKRAVRDLLLTGSPELTVVQTTGPRLGQREANVYAVLTAMAVDAGCSKLAVSAKSLLARLGLTYGHGNRATLQQTMNRLTDAKFLVRMPAIDRQLRARLVNQILSNGAVGAPAESYEITLSPGFVEAVALRPLALNLDERRQLQGDTLALWLHSLALTRPLRFQHPLAYFRRAADRMSQPAGKFLDDLEAAAQKLSVLGWEVMLPTRDKDARTDENAYVVVCRPANAKLATPKRKTILAPQTPEDAAARSRWHAQQARECDETAKELGEQREERAAS